MTTVHSVVSDDLRVIMCMKFDHRAPADEVAAFKNALISSEHVVNCCELSGAFDFMVEALLPTIAAYNEKLESIRDLVARLVTRYEVNFVCKRFVHDPGPSVEDTLWVPCRDGLKRIDCSLINKVTAEGDYIRVHVGGDSWMIHMTMRDMLGKLGDREFVHVHRSLIVRCTFIERLIHQGRLWTARLDDGSVQRVAKSHVPDVLAHLRADSSKSKHALSNGEKVTEKLVHAERM